MLADGSFHGRVLVSAILLCSCNAHARCQVLPHRFVVHAHNADGMLWCGRAGVAYQQRIRDGERPWRALHCAAAAAVAASVCVRAPLVLGDLLSKRAPCRLLGN